MCWWGFSSTVVKNSETQATATSIPANDVFAKGRMDGLITHLLRYCSEVTPEDRQWILDRYRPSVELEDSNARKRRKLNRPGSQNFESQLTDTVSFTQASEHQQRQSALDTLAEVSRQQLDHSHRPYSHDDQDVEQRMLSQMLLDQALMVNMEHQVLLPTDHDGSSDQRTTFPVITETSHYNNINIENSAAAASGLVKTASAANEQLENTATCDLQTKQNVVDPQLQDEASLHDRGSNSTSTSRLKDTTRSSNQDGTTVLMLSQDINQDNFRFQDSKIQDLESPTSVTPPTERPKGRSKFGDVRRKEVLETRKRGACIRCRMLKKPCSDGTPCFSCRKIESARLWKGACVRTRLSGECTAWTGFFDQSCRVKIKELTGGRVCAPTPERVRMYLALDTRLHIDCSAVICATETGGESTSETLCLLSDEAGLPDRLGASIRSVTEEYIRKEEDIFMRATLEHAYAKARTDVEVDPRCDMPNSINGTKQGTKGLEEVLQNAMELWIGTYMLCSEDLIATQMHQLKSQELSSSASLPDCMPEKGETASQSEELSPASKSLVQSQLLAAVEARCHRLSKAIVNDLEQRLLQRRQSSRFATFLAAVILLRCIERMSGFYYTVGKPHSSNIPDQPHTNPSTLREQGEQFAALLILLLRLRALPPTLAKTADGLIVVTSDFIAGARRPGPDCARSIDESTAAEAAAWLDPLQLNAAALVAARDAPLPPPGSKDLDALRMRFVAAILLPSGM